MTPISDHVSSIVSIIERTGMQTQDDFDAVKDELRAIHPWLGEFDLIGRIDVIYAVVPDHYVRSDLDRLGSTLTDLANVWPFGTLVVALCRDDRPRHRGRIVVYADGTANLTWRHDDIVTVMRACLGELRYTEARYADAIPLVG